MTGKIQFKMRSEPARLRVAPAAEPPTPRNGSGSFDDEALAALEAALGTLDGALPPAPVKASASEPVPELADLLDQLEASLPPAPALVPAVTATTTHSGLRTARELIAAMDTSPVSSPAPMTAQDWIPATPEAEPPSTSRIESAVAPTEPKELRNGDLPARPVAPVTPERPRRALAPPLEPPDFQLSVAKPRRFRWPFGR